MTECRRCRFNTLVSVVARVRPAKYIVHNPRHNPEAPPSEAACAMHLAAAVEGAFAFGLQSVTIEQVAR